MILAIKYNPYVEAKERTIFLQNAKRVSPHAYITWKGRALPENGIGEHIRNREFFPTGFDRILSIDNTLRSDESCCKLHTLTSGQILRNAKTNLQACRQWWWRKKWWSRGTFLQLLWAYYRGQARNLWLCEGVMSQYRQAYMFHSTNLLNSAM